MRQKLNDNLVFFSLSSVVQFLVVEIKPFFIEKLGLLLWSLSFSFGLGGGM